MSYKWVVTFVLLFISIPHRDQLDLSLLSQFKLQWSTREPGNALAFKTSVKNAFLCTQGVCYQASNKWSLFGTKMNLSGNMGLLFQSPHGWVTKDFEVESSLFERNQKHMVELRLPAGVVNDINSGSEQIFVNRVKDKELFKINSKFPLSTRWVWPVSSVVTSEFGSPRTPPNGVPYAHTGVDIHAPLGTKVRACSDGIIIDVESDPIYGNVITIDHGQGLLSRYMHLSKFEVAIGDFVKAGEYIGLSGNTGRSEAPHFHWELRVKGRPVNPIQTTLLLEHLAYLE